MLCVCMNEMGGEKEREREREREKDVMGREESSNSTGFDSQVCHIFSFLWSFSTVAPLEWFSWKIFHYW